MDIVNVSLLVVRAQYYLKNVIRRVNSSRVCASRCTDSGDVYRWGGSNQPRDPTTKLLLQAQATKVSFPERIKKLSVGFGHAVFVSDTGVVYVLGSGTRGQLGLGDETTEVVDPHNLPPLSNALVVDACAGGHHTLLLDGTKFSDLIF